MRERSFSRKPGSFGQTFGFLLLLVFAFFSLSQGETLVLKNENTLSLKNQLAKGDLEHYQKFSLLTNSYFVYDPDSTEEKMSTDVYGFKGKSVKKAFVYSLLIPGTGEFYAGSKIKAVIFLGLDVTLWALYFNYHGKGKDKEDEYQKFADRYWWKDEYEFWLYDSVYHNEYSPQSWNPNVTPANVCDTFPYWENNKWVYLSHHLPDEKTDQYYEMIGKYEQFKFGWDDFPDDLDEIRRNIYLDVRENSNRWLNKAKYSAMFSLANHILSAFDAAIAVKRYNKKGERFSQIEFKMRLTERDNEVVPKLFMSMRF